MTQTSRPTGPFSGAALLSAVQAAEAQRRAGIPSTTNRRTRAIEPVIRAAGLEVWMGGRTAGGGTRTEHGVYLPEGKTVQDVQAAVESLGWPGAGIRVEGTNPRRARMGDAFVVWITVPRP